MRGAARALDELRTVAAEVAAAERDAARLRRKLETRMRRAVDAGVPSAEVARAAGLSASRVSQVAPRPPAPAEAPPPVESPDELPRLPDGPLLSALASTRSVRRYNPRRTVWAHLGSHGVTEAGALFAARGHTAAELLASLPGDVSRVYLTGERPGLDGPEDSDAANVRAWCLADPGQGWSVAEAGHYLSEPTLPVCRWTHASGRAVELHRAASWLGEGDYSPAQARDAHGLLGELLAGAFEGGAWLSTPATTGRDLWRRTIGPDKEWPVLSDELRELLHATAGQGRSELLAPAGAELPGFVYLDGRLMYAALTWGMPVGEPRRWTGAEVGRLADDERVRLFRGRGRWLVRATVPRGWDHVGLLMARDPGGLGWRYPARPGETFDTWADGGEVHLAQEHGWRVEPVEGITWAEGKPLDTWTRKLVECWHAAGERAPDPEVAGLTRGAVRAVILFAVGAFAARTHMVTRTVRESEAAGLAPRGGVRRVGEHLTWQEPAKANAWSAAQAHPEWSACVWARARTRLLDGPSGTPGVRVGALHVPRSSVLGFRTDALYLTENPRWPDDGKPGRFRVKGALRGPVAAPGSLAELFALRDRAEDASSAA